MTRYSVCLFHYVLCVQVQVVSVAPPTDNTAEKETSQMKKKRPPAPSR